MSKLDRLINELSIQKQLFFGALAIAAGLVAWVVSNFNTFPRWVTFLAAIGVIASIVFAYTKHKRMYQLLDEIENV